MALSPTVIGH
jgi:hypothetical protein